MLDFHPGALGFSDPKWNGWNVASLIIYRLYPPCLVVESNILTMQCFMFQTRFFLVNFHFRWLDWH